MLIIINIKAPLCAFIYSIFYFISLSSYADSVVKEERTHSANKKLVNTIQSLLDVSDEWKIDPALMLAIAQTESGFNPSAISKANAYGLMQIVPATAGKDIAKWLTGKDIELPSEYLLQPDKNLMVGAAYLSYLQKHYFSYVEDKDLNRLLTIVAYNGGIGTVIRIFGLDKKENKLSINNMSYQNLYDYLLSKHPFKETRNYLVKVERRYSQYKMHIAK